MLQVLLNGRRVGQLERSGNYSLIIGDAIPDGLSDGTLPRTNVAVLDIVVEAMGRANDGWRFDVKGLPSQQVFLDGVQPSHAHKTCQDEHTKAWWML